MPACGTVRVAPIVCGVPNAARVADVAAADRIDRLGGGNNVSDQPAAENRTENDLDEKFLKELKNAMDLGDCRLNF